MSKKDFLEKLSYELAIRKIQGIPDIIADFETHFEEAVRAGQSEEEICEMLGSPTEIAEQCIEESTYTETQPVVYNNSNGIYIQLISANLELVPCDLPDFDINIARHGLIIDPDQIQKEFIIDTSENSLHITQVRNNIATWILGLFEVKTVIVGVPASFNGIIQTKITSGNMKLIGSMRAKTLSSEVSSGNTKVINLTSESMNMHSLSGNISVEQCNGDLTAIGHSGNVNVTFHHGNVNAESSSGSVSVETDVINKNSVIGTKSGNIKLKLNSLENDLNLKCVSGNIKFTVYNLHGNITAKTTSGNVTGNLSSDTIADFRLKSSSSGVKNEFEGSMQPSSIPIVTLSSLSGNVKIKKI